MLHGGILGELEGRNTKNGSYTWVLRVMGAIKNLTGRRFGRLTVKRDSGRRDSNGSVLWECVCSCGGTAFVAGRSMIAGKSRSCGCLNNENRTLIGSTLMSLRSKNARLNRELEAANREIAYLTGILRGSLPTGSRRKSLAESIPDPFQAVYD